VGIYLGIDGGGSKTSCAIGDETSLLGTGTAGASNFVRVGGAKARESLAVAIQQACAIAGVTPTQVQRTCVGLAGGARIEVSDWARQTMSELVGGEIEIVGDMVTALEAAFGGGPGAIVISGTGSIAYARNSKGEIARAGGWGFAISDEGSGHWIGRLALGAALRAEDIEPSKPSLLTHLLAAWNLPGREELVVLANATPPPDFAALLPAVMKASDSGDATASGVLTRAGEELASLAAVVIDKILRDEVPHVAISGGVFRHSHLVREVFYNVVRSQHPKAHIKPEVIDPVQGALALARRGRK
jgi:N-acetylglucosamine kinase-like BadF-type ATPase